MATTEETKRSDDNDDGTGGGDLNNDLESSRITMVGSRVQHEEDMMQPPQQNSRQSITWKDDNNDSNNKNNNERSDSIPNNETLLENNIRSLLMNNKNIQNEIIQLLLQSNVQTLLENDIRLLLMNNKNIQDEIIQLLLQSNTHIPKQKEKEKEAQDQPKVQDEMEDINDDRGINPRSASKRISRAIFPSILRLQNSKRRLPRDIFTLIALQNSSWWSNALVILTWSLQLAFVGCLILENPLNGIFLEENEERKERIRVIDSGICQNYPTTIAYFLAVIVALFHQHDLRISWSLSKDGFHPHGQMSDFSTWFRWYLSIFLRLIVGGSPLYVAYMVIHNSKSVLEILLNLLAAEALSGLDNHIFEWAVDGFFNSAIQHDAKRVTDVIYFIPSNPPPLQRTWEKVKSAPICSMGFFFLCLFGLPVNTARLVHIHCNLEESFNTSLDCFDDIETNRWFGKHEWCNRKPIYDRLNYLGVNVWDYSGDHRNAALNWLANDDESLILPNDHQPRLATRYALAAFYFSTCDFKYQYSSGDSRNCRQPWANTLGSPGFLSYEHECSWSWALADDQGVSCNSEDMVKSIILDGNDMLLSGSIPYEITYLSSSLEELRLINHSFRSKPYLTNFQALYSLTNLTVLDLSGNLLNELADVDVYRSLFDIRGNRERTAVLSLSSLTNLRELNLSVNRLNQTIPEHLAALTQLESLNLSNSQLTGPILPSTFTTLTVLRTLDLSWNQLRGTLPTELSHLTSLEYLGLKGNTQLSGNLEFMCNLQDVGMPPIVITTDCDTISSNCSCCTC